ncbi:MAG: TIGR04282 family arsenosugar biosynthesis glycosyltransferase, partial [Myxococcota bacterium]
MLERVIVFSKAPVVGRVKTRLGRSLGPEEATRVYRALLSDTLRALFSAPGLSGTLACDPAPDPFLRKLAAAWKLDLDEQRGADLTARLGDATARARARGAERVLFTGADSPTLPRHFVDLALARLRGGADVVLGPSFDGGYTIAALGPRADPAAVFADVPWYSDQALAATRGNVERAGLALGFVPTWYDVDVLADLAYLRDH